MTDSLDFSSVTYGLILPYGVALPLRNIHIGNYDLKEEVIDYFSNSFIESINTLNLNSVLLEELLDNYAVKYISLDVFNIKEN